MADGGGFSLGTLWVEVKASVDQAIGALGDLASKTVDSVGSQTTAWTSLAGVGKMLASAGIAGVLVDAAAESLAAAKEVEKLHGAFVTLNGATAETENLFASIGALETSSMFDFEDTLGPAAESMLKMGVSAATVDQSMKAFVDTAAAMRLEPQKIEAMAAAFGKMNNESALTEKSMKALTAAIGTEGWEALAAKLGTDVPGAMAQVKAGAVDAKAAMSAITEGLSEKFGGAAEELTHSWAGAMNALDQASEDVMVALGSTLKDVLDSLAPVLETVVGWIRTAAQWFTDLPSPIKSAVVIFGALVAAVAGATAVIGPLVAGFGIIAGAISGPVLAIAAVVAGLVALGAWVYSNWTPIVAVLSQAWENIKSAWMRFSSWVLGWVLSWIQPIVNAVSKIPGLGDALAPLKSGIDALTKGNEALGKSLDEAHSKQKSLADTWKDAQAQAKGMEQDTGAVADATKAAAKAAAELDAATDKGTGTLKSATYEQKQNAKALAESAKEMDKAERAADKLEKATQRAANVRFAAFSKSLEAASKETDKAAIAGAKLQLASINAGVSMEEFAVSAGVAVDALGKVGTGVELLNTPVYDLERGLKRLGVTSKAELQAIADEAQAAYDAVVASGSASQWEEDSALIKLLNAQKAAAKAAGGDIAADQQAMLDKLNAQAKDTKTGVPAVQSAFTNLSNSVSTVITNFAQDISKSLWEGGTSWGEKGKALLTSLGQAVTSSFIEPATKALNTFISDVIGDLLGGKGFGGVFDSLKDIGGSIGGIFGGGGAAGGAADAAAGGGGVGGAIGGAAGSGLAGILTSVFSGISAVTDVLSMFGVGVQGRIKELLGEIHNDTSYLAWNFDQGGLHDALLGLANNFAAYASGFGGWYHDSIASLMWTCEQSQMALATIDANMLAASMRLSDMFEADNTGRMATNGLLDRMLDQLAAIDETLGGIRATQERQYAISLYGSDPATVAANIATQLRLQGAQG